MLGWLFYYSGIRMKSYLLFILLFSCLMVFAQSSVDLEESDIESPDQQLIQKIKKLKTKSISDLVHLSPFSDVVVLQRRFMPKTGRISLSSSTSFILSSEFFLNPGLELHFAYHFLEKHGIELSGYYVLSFRRGVTGDFKTIELRADEVNPITNGFLGLTYKWMPVYGKIALYDRQILAFDTFLNIGGGMSTLSIKNSRNQIVWEPTFVAGIGQVFAITRDLGLRWDLRWHLTFRLTNDPTSGFLSDFPFSIGLTYYYPSAGVR